MDAALMNQLDWYVVGCGVLGDVLKDAVVNRTALASLCGRAILRGGRVCILKDYLVG